MSKTKHLTPPYEPAPASLSHFCKWQHQSYSGSGQTPSTDCFLNVIILFQSISKFCQLYFQNISWESLLWHSGLRIQLQQPLLWLGFDPWPERPLICCRCGHKNKKKKNQHHHHILIPTISSHLTATAQS